METQTKINIGTIATLLALIGTFTYVGLSKDAVNYQEPNYYCINASIKMYCNSLTAYYGLVNGKCINKDFGNKLCRSGWELIPEIVKITDPESISVIPVGKIHCTKDGCITI